MNAAFGFGVFTALMLFAAVRMAGMWRKNRVDRSLRTLALAFFVTAAAGAIATLIALAYAIAS